MSIDFQNSLANMFRYNLWTKTFFTSPPGGGGMESPSFVPNPLNNPALMVLASTAEGHEAPRLQHPHHPFPGQSMDKDAPVPPPPPFSTSGFMYRPGDPFGPPLYSPLSFVRPGLDRQLALLNPAVRQPGAFRPLGTTSEDSPYHSAFSPAKKAKNDESHRSLSSEGPSSSDREDRREFQEDRASPCDVKEERPSSISSAGYDTISEPPSDSGETYNERGTPDSEGRSLRKQRKRIALDGQTPCCPVCGLTLRAGELEAHLSLEVDKLNKIFKNGRKSRDTTPQGRKSLPSPSGSRKGKDSPTPELASRSRYDNFLRIRCNRQSRLSARSRNKKKRVGEEGLSHAVCPVCSERLSGSTEDLHAHVEMCLKQRDGEEEPVDVEGEFEEYEWAGQTRIRAASLLEGGYSGTGLQTVSSKRVSDDDGELNVDGDDTEQYGKAQFSENDIIPLGMESDIKYVDNSGPQDLSMSAKRFSSRTDTVNSDGPSCSYDSLPGKESTASGSETVTELVSSLKAKLDDIDADKTSKQKCLICMEAYSTPLTSIQCWHVHCEACWMRTLGAKKLCPQCNMITSPSDLRRIYL